jgi:hypothetical protein
MPISNLAWWLYISGDSDAARAALKTYVSAPRTICMEMVLPNVGIGETVLVVEASPEARVEILRWRDQSYDPDTIGNLNVVSGPDVNSGFSPEEGPDEEPDESTPLLAYTFKDLAVAYELGGLANGQF